MGTPQSHGMSMQMLGIRRAPFTGCISYVLVKAAGMKRASCVSYD